MKPVRRIASCVRDALCKQRSPNRIGPVNATITGFSDPDGHYPLTQWRTYRMFADMSLLNTTAGIACANRLLTVDGLLRLRGISSLVLVLVLLITNGGVG